MIIEMLMMMEMITEAYINFLNKFKKDDIFFFIFIKVFFFLTFESYPMISAPMNDDRSC